LEAIDTASNVRGGPDVLIVASYHSARPSMSRPPVSAQTQFLARHLAATDHIVGGHRDIEQGDAP
jgi:hypothetical protein